MLHAPAGRGRRRDALDIAHDIPPTCTRVKVTGQTSPFAVLSIGATYECALRLFLCRVVD